MKDMLAGPKLCDPSATTGKCRGGYGLAEGTAQGWHEQPQERGERKKRIKKGTLYSGLLLISKADGVATPVFPGLRRLT